MDRVFKPRKSKGEFNLSRRKQLKKSKRKGLTKIRIEKEIAIHNLQWDLFRSQEREIKRIDNLKRSSREEKKEKKQLARKQFSKNLNLSITSTKKDAKEKNFLLPKKFSTGENLKNFYKSTGGRNDIDLLLDFIWVEFKRLKPRKYGYSLVKLKWYNKETGQYFWVSDSSTPNEYKELKTLEQISLMLMSVLERYNSENYKLSDYVITFTKTKQQRAKEYDKQQAKLKRDARKKKKRK